MSSSATSAFNFSNVAQALEAISEQSFNSQRLNPLDVRVQLFIEDNGLNLLELKWASINGNMKPLIDHKHLISKIIQLFGSIVFFTERLKSIEDEVLQRVPPLKMNSAAQIQFRTVRYALLSEANLKALQIGSIGSRELDWALLAQRLNLIEKSSPEAFNRYLPLSLASLTRIVDLPIGKFIKITPQYLNELRLTTPLSHHVMIIIPGQITVQSVVFGDLVNLADQPGSLRDIFIAADMETCSEEETYFNEKVHELTLGQIRSLTSEEFCLVGVRMEPHFWCLASKNQLAGIELTQLPQELLENLLRGDGTWEEFVARYQVLSGEQVEHLIPRMSPNLYRDYRMLFSSVN